MITTRRCVDADFDDVHYAHTCDRHPLDTFVSIAPTIERCPICDEEALRITELSKLRKVAEKACAYFGTEGWSDIWHAADELKQALTEAGYSPPEGT